MGFQFVEPTANATRDDSPTGKNGANQKLPLPKTVRKYRLSLRAYFYVDSSFGYYSCICENGIRY